MASDLHDHGYGEVGIDFLTEFRECDWILTNPPFKYAQEFVEHGLMCVRDGGIVSMLLKLQFLEGVARGRWLRSSGLSHVYVFSKRIRLDSTEVTGNERGGMLAFAWYVWTRGYKCEPVIRWIYE